MTIRIFVLTVIIATSFTVIDAAAQTTQPSQKQTIPHGQSAPPGPPLSPQEALKKMTVPPGFHVELVAAEPDIVNPVAMTFDERGRIWITESIEYPRHSAGPGKDRVKVLESTKGDGKFDKITTVIEGLNIPSGIAVGHGGVWVANAPDILFYPFEDFAAPKLGKPQVGGHRVWPGRHARTAELADLGPGRLALRPQRRLQSSAFKHKGKDLQVHLRPVPHPSEDEGLRNLLRRHQQSLGPRLQRERRRSSSPPASSITSGTSPRPATTIGRAALSAVHLEDRLHRQAPPSEGGLLRPLWFDSDAYPPEYREKLYMGNIHGNCINCDELTRDGSTYPAKPRPDFLTANDAWFMPVAQKIGPDGCMYILDWYDRYHCYQDASRDPAGIDRMHGRLYRVVYKDYKPAGKFDLSEGKF